MYVIRSSWFTCSQPDNHCLPSCGLVSCFITGRIHSIYLTTGEDLQKNCIERYDQFFESRLSSIFLPLRWAVSPLVLSLALIIKEWFAYYFFHLLIEVSHFTPLAILTGKRKKERTEKAMYEVCFLRAKMGELRGKDRTISFQRGEQRKVVEKKIDRIIYQVSDGSVWHIFWRIQRHQWMFMLASFTTMPALNKMTRTGCEYCINAPSLLRYTDSLGVECPELKGMHYVIPELPYRIWEREHGSKPSSLAHSTATVIGAFQGFVSGWVWGAVGQICPLMNIFTLICNAKP